MFKNKFTEITLLVLTLVSAIFVVVNAFTDWIKDVYPISVMICLLLLDAVWRNGHADKT